MEATTDEKVSEGGGAISLGSGLFRSDEITVDFGASFLGLDRFFLGEEMAAAEGFRPDFRGVFSTTFDLGCDGEMAVVG